MSERRPRRHRIRVGTAVRYIGQPRSTFREDIPTGAEGIVTQELVPESSGYGPRWHRGEIEFPTINTGVSGSSHRWNGNWPEGSLEEIGSRPRRTPRNETLPEGYYRDAQGKLRSVENHPPIS